MFDSTLSDQIEVLRVRLETALPMPVLLVVSSALKDDGKSLVATGLANSMHAAGYSTLLVHSDEPTNGAFGALDPKSLDEVLALGIARYVSGRTTRSSANVITLSSESIRHTVSRSTIARFGEMCRASSQVTIVDAAVALGNSFAMLSALASDSVLLTYKQGRRVCGEDRQLARTLAREEIPFWGVVSVAPKLIRTATIGISVNTVAKPSTANATVTGGSEPKRQAV